MILSGDQDYSMRIEDIPYNYASCYATSAECAQAAHCLRRHVALFYEQIATPPDTQACITPTHVKQVAQGLPCEHFRDDTLHRYALGMSHLFDLVPHGIYPKVRNEVMEVFNSRRAFFYAQKGEQLISPIQQKQIAAIFASVGLAAPSFDDHVFFPDWTH